MVKRQTVWARAVDDTSRVREHLWWFFAWELVGVATCGALGYVLTPEPASRVVEALFPAVGLVIGGLAVLGMVYLWNLLWAAARQRNEAWAREDVTPAIECVSSYPVIGIFAGKPADGLLIIPDLRIENNDDRPIDLGIDAYLKPDGEGSFMLPLESLDYAEVGHWVVKNFAGLPQLHQPIHVDARSWVQGNAVFAVGGDVLELLRPYGLLSIESLKIELLRGRVIVKEQEIWPSIWISTLGADQFEGTLIEAAPERPFLETSIVADPEKRWAWLQVENHSPPATFRATVRLNDTGQVEHSYRPPWRDGGGYDRELGGLDPGVLNVAEVAPKDVAPPQEMKGHTVVRFYSTANADGFFDRVLPYPKFFRVGINVFRADAQMTTSQLYILQLLDAHHLRLLTIDNMAREHRAAFTDLFVGDS